MEAKELFIYNETYPLPLDKYAEFKSRRDGCARNPMCINKLKYDAETFIADFGKKHGKKIETGEESGFTILKDGEFAQKAEQVKEKISDKVNSNQLIVMGILIALGVYAIVKKDTTVGAIAILAVIVLLSIGKDKGNVI